MKFLITAAEKDGSDTEITLMASDENEALRKAKKMGLTTYGISQLLEAEETKSTKVDICCVMCSSKYIQLIPVDKRQLGTAIFAELLVGTAAGVTMGKKQMLLNTCMKCGAQWAPGSSKTVKEIQMEKADRQTSFWLIIGVIFFGVLAVTLLLATNV